MWSLLPSCCCLQSKQWEKDCFSKFTVISIKSESCWTMWVSSLLLQVKKLIILFFWFFRKTWYCKKWGWKAHKSSPFAKPVIYSKCNRCIFKYFNFNVDQSSGSYLNLISFYCNAGLYLIWKTGREQHLTFWALLIDKLSALSFLGC